MRIIANVTLFTLASAALTASAMLLSTPASASPADAPTHRIEVPYGDLDLTDAAARATLHHRINAAAYNVCRADGDIAGQAASAMCRDQAITDATRRMNTVIAAANTPRHIARR